MDIPNVRPGALSGTMQEFGADPLPVETVETPTQADALDGHADDSDEQISLDVGEPETVSTEQTSDGGDGPLPPIEQTGGDELPPADLDEAIEWVKAAQPDETETRRRADAMWAAFSGESSETDDALAGRLQDAVYIGPPATQTMTPAGIESTAEVNGQPDAQSAADGPAGDGATGEPPAPSEAASDAESAPSGADSADDDGQNSTSSPTAGSGSD